ncbi:MAG: thiamine-phosphate kinase [Campylobacterota bacterium]|nr:thiamine-phosphate kinase [Campylobacterota bacterium]
MNSEDYFIQCMRQYSHSIGDDGAVIANTVYSKDAFFEEVHFKRSWMTPYQIATKAMMVNISDAVAMNARAKYALLSVAMPKNLSKYEMTELARGFQESAAKFGIEIIGGDTIANSKLDITVTIISESKKPLYRQGLKENDLLCYTGKLGESKRDLLRVMRGGKLHTKSRFISLHVRDEFIAKNRSLLRVGMDISDGLFSDLEKLARINRCGFHFDKKVAKSLGCSGEEYEMLIGIDKRHRKALVHRAKQLRVPLTIFARVKRKHFKNLCKAHHF